jgi:hypothetical protein
VINNTTPDVGYTQMTVAGVVDITGVNLSLSGSYVPMIGDTFIIIANDGLDPVIGTLNGLPEGAIIPNFLGSPTLSAKITYQGGGSNNDVVLTVVAPTAAPASISGRIVDNHGQPIGGATVTVDGGSNVVRTITNANGQYALGDLPTGDFYTVTHRCQTTFSVRRADRSRCWLIVLMQCSREPPSRQTRILLRVRSSLCDSSIWTSSVASRSRPVCLTGAVNCALATPISIA